jgi:disulfide bond formation protein DsbB
MPAQMAVLPGAAASRTRSPILSAVDVEAAQVFFSLLAVLAGGGAIVLLGARLAARSSPSVAALVAAVDDAALWIAFLVAATCMAGSLYFSEVADYVPCRLCWFQRIAMYPLAVILLVAAIRRDRAVRWYVGPLAAIGALVSTYHYLVEWNPSLEGGVCGIGPACSAIWFRELGFVTLAFMALCGFAAILVLVVPRPPRTLEPS